ncbi:MAG: alpha/beta fold hydrolase [Acidimicrobiales bacterium]
MLATDQWGAGQAVLYIHGLEASARYWHPMRQFGSEYHGPAPDLPGCGR